MQSDFRKEDFTVLYVDDEVQNLVSFNAAFRRTYKVLIAESGFKALEILANNTVCVIITDQRMPKMSGTELLEQVRNMYPSIIRMVITGYSDVEAIIGAINKGQVFRYIIKPWDENELRITLDNALQLFAAEQNYRELFNELQQKVIERTAEIEQQKEEISAQRDSLELLNQELKKQKESIELTNKNITASITYALRIQQAILPGKSFIASLIKQSFIFYRSKDIVSGDFYWFRQKNEIVYFAAVDCTGHGVPGAFMSIVANNMLNHVLDTAQNKVTPAELLNLVSININKTLRNTVHDNNIKDGMDIALCAYDKSNKSLQYAGAGNPLVIIRNSEIIEYKPDKFPVGELFDETFSSYRNNYISLQTDDMLYLYSDGYIDQFGGEHQRKFMKKNFQKLLISLHKYEIEVQKIFIEKAFDEWKGNNNQTDDVLIIGVKIS